MSLALQAGLDRLTGTESNLIIAGLAVIVFLWLYIRTSRSLRAEAAARLELLQRTLALYSRAQGVLGEEVEAAHVGAQEPDQLVQLLQECKAAPLMTPELLDMIDAYIRERDFSRLLMLQKMLDREIHRRIHEQSVLIRKIDNPGWGTSFWRMIRPAVPFAALVLTLYWFIQLYNGFQDSGAAALSWTSLELWTRLISCLAATLFLYWVIMDTRRDTPGILYRLLALIIAAVALLHLLGLTAAPYILAVQVVLFLFGFTLNPKPSRRNRPYAGHREVTQDNEENPKDR
ncbi:hypothetical protein [Paenibacillus sp. Y412MC10]|uniref:hypothetical protein n=1 Tax=Geobacillus sp. (strain Y412MC10) TaxID=481743 RepID=UPI0011AB5559|nr:hypothetical protein [Paenibacillus sp. Y412MC10]